jgi:hypothetical protein
MDAFVTQVFEDLKRDSHCVRSSLIAFRAVGTNFIRQGAERTTRAFQKDTLQVGHGLPPLLPLLKASFQESCFSAQRFREKGAGGGGALCQTQTSRKSGRQAPKGEKKREKTLYRRGQPKQ